MQTWSTDTEREMSISRRGILGLAIPSAILAAASSKASANSPHTNTEGVRAAGQDSLSPAMQQQRLPRFQRKLSAYGYGLDNKQSEFTIVGMGSSVGNGATLLDPNTQAPVFKFAEFFKKYYDPVGIYPIKTVNRSVNGSVVIEGCDKHWDKLISDGIKPDLVLLCYGMNDFMTSSFNAGETAPYFKWKMKQLIEKIQDAGAEAVVVTSPHPHSKRVKWYLEKDEDQAWPDKTPAPVSSLEIIPSAIKSIVYGDFLQNGSKTPASERFLRGNDFIREVAEETGSPLIDLEYDWFLAINKFGEDSLFDKTVYNHPNLLGHQNSYWKSLEKFCIALKGNSASVSDRQSFNRVGISPPDEQGDVLDTTQSRITIAAKSDESFARCVRLIDKREALRIEYDGSLVQTNYLYDSQDSTAKCERKISNGRVYLNLSQSETITIPANCAGMITLRGKSGVAKGIDSKILHVVSDGLSIEISQISEIKTTDAALNVMPHKVNGHGVEIVSGLNGLQLSWSIDVTSITD